MSLPASVALPGPAKTDSHQTSQLSGTPSLCIKASNKSLVAEETGSVPLPFHSAGSKDKQQEALLPKEESTAFFGDFLSIALHVDSGYMRQPRCCPGAKVSQRCCRATQAHVQTASCRSSVAADSECGKCCEG